MQRVRALVLSAVIAMGISAPLTALAQPTAPASAYAAPESERSALLARVDALSAAIAARDQTAFASLFLPKATMAIQIVGEQGPALRRPTIEEFLGQPWTSTAEERMWNPVILARGPIASVWTAYEFKRNGAVTHCGVNALDFVKVEGAWKIAHASFTVEPNACAELSNSQ